MRTLLLSLITTMIISAQGPGTLKPGNADTIKLTFYNDNWSMVFINGKLVAVSPIDFLPHAQMSVNVLPEYPMTIAVLAKDNADPLTGLEYGNHIGDAGFILKMSDGTVSNATWKVKSFFRGPLNGDINNPTVQYTPIPPNWFAANFDDILWDSAAVYTSDRVKPDGLYDPTSFAGASFIWSADLDLDNTIIMRTTVQAPKGYVKNWNTTPDLNVRNVFSEAQLATVTSPNLFVNNAAGLALGYVTRVGNGQQTVEQLAQVNNGVASALAIDLGPATDQVFLTLFGSNLGALTSGTANINGVSIPLAYAGPQGGTAGLAQFVMALPRTLAGLGSVGISVTANGTTSNTVTVTVR